MVGTHDATHCLKSWPTSQNTKGDSGMPLSEELKYLDATALAALVRKKEIKPIELVDDAIERIEKLNPTLNAVITPMYEIARDAAQSKLPDGPFTGVPFLLKDVLASYGGVPLSMGSKALKHVVPNHDSELVRRYKNAGLIVLGKTNLSEFALLPATESEAFGPTKNPWDVHCSPGGSSGGAAVVVASRIVPMAHGTDGGGSIRIPASCCGVFGLKPTRARISMGPDYGDIMSGLASEHALTLSVRDSAALLDSTAGCMLGDPYWAPPVTRPFIHEIGADTGKLRIAFSSETLGSPVHEDCVNAVKDAALLCESLGHDVEEASPMMSINESGNLIEAFFINALAAGASMVKMLVKKMGLSEIHFEKLSWGCYQLAASYDAADYVNAEQTIHRASRCVASFFNTYDIFLSPTMAQLPPPLGSFDATPENPFNGWTTMMKIYPFTGLFNATGQPAMSVPLYWNANGLPIGAHFVGRFGDEATLFRLASQLEAARPWMDRRPPICA